VQDKRIAIVGAGPAGMMAAIRAACLSRQVSLFERNSSPGRKLLLSGKGRCNITNTSSLEGFLKRFSKNGEFLRDAFKKFFNQELIDFFRHRGLELKVERQLRVFPATDSAESVLEVLKKELAKKSVKINYNSKIHDIIVKDNRVTGVLPEGKSPLFFESVVMATGGASYSFTGSDAGGLKIVEGKGHKIIKLRPGLVGLKVKEGYPKLLEGLTLKNISLEFTNGKKRISSEVGEMVFTAEGISGPLVFGSSAKIIDWLDQKEEVYVEINLKPGLSIEKLDNRLLREFKANPKKGIKSIMKGILPVKLGELILKIARVAPDKKANQISSKERDSITGLLSCWRLEICGCGSIEEGMVTRGGVSLKEIDPRTMESKIVKGLYFCGEMIDIDADTGGFNLQAAFSTGYLAGESAALSAAVR